MYLHTITMLFILFDPEFTLGMKRSHSSLEHLRSVKEQKILSIQIHPIFDPSDKYYDYYVKGDFNLAWYSDMKVSDLKSKIASKINYYPPFIKLNYKEKEKELENDEIINYYDKMIIIATPDPYLHVVRQNSGEILKIYWNIHQTISDMNKGDDVKQKRSHSMRLACFIVWE